MYGTFHYLSYYFCIKSGYCAIVMLLTDLFIDFRMIYYTFIKDCYLKQESRGGARRPRDATKRNCAGLCRWCSTDRFVGWLELNALSAPQ